MIAAKMTDIHIYSHNRYSNGAKNLAKAMNIHRIKHDHSKFKGNPNKILINWGSRQLSPQLMKCTIINHPAIVEPVQNKLACLCLLKKADVCIPEFTTDQADVVQWLEQGCTIVCRKILRGHGGIGIVLATTLDEVVDAPLYTKYIKKQDEYRIHIINDKAFDVQQKARRFDEDKPNYKIRVHDNGFIYKRAGVMAPVDVMAQAKAAIKATSLDFGAVDVVWNQHQKKAYVLEINTAPGLEGTTVQNYVREFKTSVL